MTLKTVFGGMGRKKTQKYLLIRILLIERETVFNRKIKTLSVIINSSKNMRYLLKDVPGVGVLNYFLFGFTRISRSLPFFDPKSKILLLFPS